MAEGRPDPRVLGQFLAWATASSAPTRRSESPPRRQYQDSNSTGSGSSRYYEERDSSSGRSRQYGPSRTYDYHARSPSPQYRGQPYHQDSRNYAARGTGYRERSPRRRSPPPRRYRSPPRRGRGGHGRRYNAMGPPAARYDNRRDTDADLRNLALQSRHKNADRGRVDVVKWVRTQFPPDISKADLDNAGHPICPLEADEDDEDDFGSDSGAPRLPSNWKAMEAARRADAIEHEKRGSRMYKRNTVDDVDSLGAWAGKKIDTAEEAANLLRWVKRTEPGAFQLMHCERVRLGSDPTILRTEGQVYLLQRQNSASEQYWYASTGRRKGPARYEMPAPPAPDSGSRADKDAYVYLGTALLGENDTVVILPETALETSGVSSGSHTTLMDAGRMYDAMEHSLWPYGMRVSETQFANVKDRHAIAHRNDVMAWYTINALAPRRNRVGSSIFRSKFMEILIRLLSVAGTYSMIALAGEYVMANRALEHYPFLTLNITFSQVVGWFIQHGITPDGDAIVILESFARARRNTTEGRDSPNPIIFTNGGIPHSDVEVAALKLGTDFCHWKDLAHDGLQDGVESSYPRRPANAMDEE
ncbi:hypothetical protein DFH06DRAFT_1329204 [Mycena polygramma]|nr:hypothetical protein DFH06DRAFT_1329204 [Mycena polygramma]